MSIYWNADTHRRNTGALPIPAECRSIRLRNMKIGGKTRNVAISMVDTNDKIQTACDLVNDRYSWRGYGASHRIRSDAHHMTFTAEVDDQVVGTVTLAVDSDDGLAADRTFSKELDEFRAVHGTSLCELTKFAFDPRIQSKELMAALFHMVFIYGRRTYGCTDLFIEVNPRHVRFYEAMLGFERVGPLKTNASVSAPAQLMRLEVAQISENINRFGGNADRPPTHSLYPFFFSPAEASNIYLRLILAETRVVEDLYEVDAYGVALAALHNRLHDPAAFASRRSAAA